MPALPQSMLLLSHRMQAVGEFDQLGGFELFRTHVGGEVHVLQQFANFVFADDLTVHPREHPG